MKTLLNNLTYIYKAACKHDKLLLYFIGINNLVMLLQIASPIVLPRYIIDSLFTAKEYSTVLSYILLFALLTIATSSIVYLLKSSIYVRSMTLRFKLIVESGKKFLSMDYMNLERPEILDLSERGDRATENNASGIEGILHRLASYGGNLIAFLALTYLIIRINFYIAMICLVLLAISWVISFKVSKFEKRMLDNLTPTNRKWDYIFNILTDPSYYKDIFMFHMEEMIFNKLAMLGKQKRYVFNDIKRKICLRDSAFSFLLAIQQIFVYIMLSTLVFKQIISIGEYTMYIAAVSSFYSLAQQTIADSIFIFQQNNSVNDFRRFIDLSINGTPSKAEPIPQVIQTIRLENVSFKYHGQSNNVLDNISLTIRKGQKIAIVGLNGAGKTTLVKLLTKLYTPASGSIYINNINIANLSHTDLYSLYSTVFQDPCLFAFTLVENISLKPLDKTDIARAKKCLDEVGLSSKLQSLKHGIFQPVLKIIDEEGVDFSGGELQKIALARALYKNTPFIILDEPTAAYDALAEERLYKMFNTLTQDKTVFYISHRLASTRFCDRIVMLENGKIIEQGTHAELMIQNGAYAKLYYTQSRYYMDQPHQESNGISFS